MKVVTRHMMTMTEKVFMLRIPALLPVKYCNLSMNDKSVNFKRGNQKSIGESRKKNHFASHRIT